jgi:CBS domain-containing protein
MTSKNVDKWMTQPVVSIDPYTRLDDAKQLMNTKNIRTLPVTNDGELIGIVTRRDLLRYDPSAAMKSNYTGYEGLEKETVDHIMSRKVTTVRSNATVGQAARVMYENKFSGLPVTDTSRKMVGIITSTDLFRFIKENADYVNSFYKTATLMTTLVETIAPYETLFEAHRLMGIMRIRALPVVDDAQSLVGIITRTDVLSADPSAFMKNRQDLSRKILSTPISFIMTSKPITINPATEVSKAAELMMTYKIHSLPVLNEENQLVGIITDSDLFRMILQKFN